jgi:hypothetical protein
MSLAADTVLARWHMTIARRRIRMGAEVEDFRIYGIKGSKVYVI